jgi:alpha-tubulin suppressor-like RCC1 family protein
MRLVTWTVVTFVAALSGCGGSEGTGAGGSGNAGGGGSSATGHAGGSSTSTGSGETGGGAPASQVLQIAGGRYHTCVLIEGGAIYCYGQGAYRQLGGDYGAQSTARVVANVGDAVAIACGDRFTCAIRPGGAVWCWGDDDHGQSGTSATTPCGDAVIDSVCIVTPKPVVGLESGVVELALGADHACARMNDGTVRCWGDNSKGQVGQSALGDVSAPTKVPGVAGAKQITAGDEHSCALLASGQVACWGADDDAQIGNGKTGTAITQPATVAGLADAVEITGGGEHTCARRANGSVVCWGYDYLGQLGNGATTPTRATSPQAVVGLTDAVELTAGRYHTCARRKNGTVACWGDNDKGEVGDGTTTQRNAPTQVIGLSGATTIAAGSWDVCAAVGKGDVLCWGDDLGGQLGDGRVFDGATTQPIPSQGLPKP